MFLYFVELKIGISMIRITTKNLPKRTKFHFMFSTEQIRRKMLMLDIFLIASFSLSLSLHFNVFFLSHFAFLRDFYP